jgi:hypothetical protein
MIGFARRLGRRQNPTALLLETERPYLTRDWAPAVVSDADGPAVSGRDRRDECGSGRRAAANSATPAEDTCARGAGRGPARMGVVGHIEELRNLEGGTERGRPYRVCGDARIGVAAGQIAASGPGGGALRPLLTLGSLVSLRPLPALGEFTGSKIHSQQRPVEHLPRVHSVRGELGRLDCPLGKIDGPDALVRGPAGTDAEAEDPALPSGSEAMGATGLEPVTSSLSSWRSPN